MEKKELSSLITNSKINEIYEDALRYGALGGKLLGAGSGGFMLFVANPKKHMEIRSALKDYVYVPIKFDSLGSQIIYYED